MHLPIRSRHRKHQNNMWKLNKVKNKKALERYQQRRSGIFIC